MGDIQHVLGMLTDIIDSLPSLLVVVDRSGVVELWNSKAELFSGIAAREAYGHPARTLLPQFAAQLECIGEVIDHTTPRSFDHIPLPSDSQRRFYSIQVYPLTSNESNRAVVRIDDVTEHVRIEEIMMQTEKMMMVGSLTAGMAHEINDPLGAILQNAQNIERRISPDIQANHTAATEVGVPLETVRAYLEKRGIPGFVRHIRQSGARASAIISSMLRFSRANDTRTETVDLAEVLDRTLELAANDYVIKNNREFSEFRIIRQYDPDLPPVPISVFEIEQVLFNIIINAVQAMTGSSDSRKPSIALRTRCRGDLATIEVEDNGPGMDESTRHRVFEPFFTTKEVGVGTGLGLAVSYAIITKNHHGQIEVSSQPDKGTCFTIHLPLKRDSDDFADDIIASRPETSLTSFDHHYIKRHT